MARPREAPAKSGTPTALVTETAPKSAAAEAYRTLRTNIQFAGLDRPCKTIVITSATPAEGKTTTAANFAAVCAQSGSRVLLVDGDLRKPTLHKIFGIDNQRGLTTTMIEGKSLADVAIPTRVPNLSGYGVDEDGGRMHDLLEAATRVFDLIVIDTPPVLSVSDAVALAAQTDGVILVVRGGKTSAEAARRAAEQIDAVKGRILGVLLNRVDARNSSYYADHGRYYWRITPWVMPLLRCLLRQR